MDTQKVEALLNEHKDEIPLLVQFLSEFLVSNEVIVFVGQGLCDNYIEYGGSGLLPDLIICVYNTCTPIEGSTDAYDKNTQKYSGESLHQRRSLALNILGIISNHTLKDQE